MKDAKLTENHLGIVTKGVLQAMQPRLAMLSESILTILNEEVTDPLLLLAGKNLKPNSYLTSMFKIL